MDGFDHLSASVLRILRASFVPMNLDAIARAVPGQTSHAHKQLIESVLFDLLSRNLVGRCPNDTAFWHVWHDAFRLKPNAKTIVVLDPSTYDDCLDAVLNRMHEPGNEHLELHVHVGTHDPIDLENRMRAVGCNEPLVVKGNVAEGSIGMGFVAWHRDETDAKRAARILLRVGAYLAEGDPPNAVVICSRNEIGELALSSYDTSAPDGVDVGWPGTLRVASSWKELEPLL